MACPLLRTLVLASTFLAAAPIAGAQTKAQVKNQGNAHSPKGTQIQLSSVATPLVFEPNRGQASPEFQWIGRGSGFVLGIEPAGASLEFRNPTVAAPLPAKPLFPNAPALTTQKQTVKKAQSELVRLHLAGSTDWKLNGANPTGGISNYFIGKD